MSCVLDTMICPESLCEGNIVTKNVIYWSFIDIVLCVFRYTCKAGHSVKYISAITFCRKRF